MAALPAWVTEPLVWAVGVLGGCLTTVVVWLFLGLAARVDSAESMIRSQERRLDVMETEVKIRLDSIDKSTDKILEKLGG